MSSISAILFIFILFFPHQSLAHDGEQHLENEHDSPNSHSESHEEGSGLFQHALTTSLIKPNHR